MTYVALMLLIGSIAWVGTNRGGRAALWFGWVVAMLLAPSWMSVVAGSMTLSPRRIGGLMGLAFLVAMPDPKSKGQGPKFRPMISDVFALALVVSVMAAEVVNRNGRPLVFPDVFLGYGLPYLVGRFFFGSTAEIGRVVKLMVACMAVLCALCFVEAVTHVSLLASPTSRSTFILNSGEGVRMGLLRVRATMAHPIFLGMLLALMLPMMLEASRRAKAGLGPFWWRGMPLATLGAIFLTVSRGPMMVALASVGGHVFFAHRRLRAVLFTVAAVGGLALYAGRDEIVPALTKLSGGDAKETISIVYDGEVMEYNGTNHRYLLFKVYRDYMARAGWFGYGRDLKPIELDETVASVFWSIDDHYIMFLLQAGYAGLGSFLLLMACSLAYLTVMAWPARPGDLGFVGAIWGGFAGLTVILFTVWLAADYGDALLFMFGLTANLRALTRAPKGSKAPAQAAAAPAPYLRVPSFPARPA